jgi:hypothetical protein
MYDNSSMPLISCFDFFEQTDVGSGSIIEVLGNVDNRNQIECETLVPFEAEQTANFGQLSR